MHISKCSLSLLLIIYRHQVAGRGRADCLSWFLCTADMQANANPKHAAQMHMDTYHGPPPPQSVRFYAAIRQRRTKRQSIYCTSECQVKARTRWAGCPRNMKRTEIPKDWLGAGPNAGLELITNYAKSSQGRAPIDNFFLSQAFHSSDTDITPAWEMTGEFKAQARSEFVKACFPIWMLAVFLRQLSPSLQRVDFIIPLCHSGS